MASHTITEVQDKLRALGYDPGPSDGAAGTMTDAAVSKFQTDKALTVTGTLDPLTLNALFPSSSTMTPKTITGSIQDYLLNLVLSKTNWAAAAMVGVLVTFLNTKFGLQIDAQTQTALSVLIAGAFAALIGLLQTAFNSPHMTTKQPAVVQQPAEIK